MVKGKELAPNQVRGWVIVLAGGLLPHFVTVPKGLANEL